MRTFKMICSGYSLLLLLLVVFSSTSCVITVGPPQQKGAGTTNKPAKVKDRANLEKELENLTFFPMSQMALGKDTKRRYDPFKITTLPFFFITDLITFLPSNTTQYFSLKAQLQQSAAAWNNPNSMIAKSNKNTRNMQ